MIDFLWCFFTGAAMAVIGIFGAMIALCYLG